LTLFTVEIKFSLIYKKFFYKSIDRGKFYDILKTVIVIIIDLLLLPQSENNFYGGNLK